MKITDIKVQTHNKERASIFVDDEYSFSLDLTSVLKFGLKIGQEIDDETIDKLNRDGNYSKIRDRAMDILTKKAVTKKTLLDMLIKKDYEKNLCTMVIDELSEIGYIDDLSFAIRYAEDAFEYKKHGKKRIEADLYKKGVSRETIDEALNECKFDFSDNIDEIINAKFKNADFSDFSVKNKIIRYLAYRGYNMSDIISAIDKMK